MDYYLDEFVAAGDAVGEGVGDGLESDFACFDSSFLSGVKVNRFVLKRGSPSSSAFLASSAFAPTFWIEETPESRRLLRNFGSDPLVCNCFSESTSWIFSLDRVLKCKRPSSRAIGFSDSAVFPR